MLTHDHPDFPSDIFTILEAAGARLIIGKGFPPLLSVLVVIDLLQKIVDTSLGYRIDNSLSSNKKWVRLMKYLERSWRDLESKTLCNLAMVWLSCDTAENFENYKKQNEY